MRSGTLRLSSVNQTNLSLVHDPSYLGKVLTLIVTNSPAGVGVIIFFLLAQILFIL